MSDSNEERSILIIEDDEKNLKLVRDILQVSGFKVYEATDGNTGVRLAFRVVPQLILLDIQMPVMNGLDAIRILRGDEKTKNIPVVALTAYAMKEDEERIRAEGFDGYITKPINVASFLKEVESYFSGTPFGQCG